MSNSSVRGEFAGAGGGDPQVSERGRKVRFLLLVSFGWLLALLIGAGLDALVSLRRLDAVSQEVSQRFSSFGRLVG